MRELYRKHKALKILTVFLIVIAVIVITTFLFLNLNPVFGGHATKEERSNYANRSEIYVNGKFIYPSEWELEGVSENKIVSGKEAAPQEELPIAATDFDENSQIDEVNVTWFGHSNMLIQMHGMNILIDPVFSERTSPISFIGPKRFSKLPLEIKDLPHIDIVVISHDHYDHLDMNSIKELDGKIDKFIVPLGVENHLERWGVSPDKITNMAWWEETDVDGLIIACTPAR
nr:MBL fold metallo-hydrolase [Ruminococcus sp.]